MTEIILKNGWIKLDRSELNPLREQIRRKYEMEGGSKAFNSHLPNYEELREFIQARIDDIYNEQGIRFLVQGQVSHEIVPGRTFFKDLFYTKRDIQGSQFQEYNIDVCYIYLFGKPRFEHKLSEKKVISEIQTIRPARDSSLNLIVSSTLNNMNEAERIKIFLSERFGIHVENELRNSYTFGRPNLAALYDNIGPNTYILSLISRDYLQNEVCVKELIEFTSTNLDTYIVNTLHILLKDIYSGDFNIFDSLGRSELVKYWMLRYEKLEENHKLLMSANKDKEFYTRLRKELDDIRHIVEELHRLIDLIKENRSNVLYDILLTQIENDDDLIKILPKKESNLSIDVKLEKAYKRIKIPSTNDPAKPEFPPYPFYKPKFPASNVYKIDVPGFKNVWLKDESTNPTGTHKDRMAWEVVIKYKTLIESLKYSKNAKLPQMSIISSGSAAIAIQHLFNLFRIPTALKVLVDIRLNSEIKESIQKIGCELYEYDLSDRLLSPDDIKELTDNKNGIDITYREVLDPTHDNYYDWLSYEILREKVDYCFIPFGTGDLFINVLNIIKIEYFYSFASRHDPRFQSDTETLKKCHFMGASTNNPNSRMDKLFSNFLPSLSSFRKYIEELKNEYACVGSDTGIYYVSEGHVEEAIHLADKQGIIFEPSGLAGLALLLQKKDEIPRNSRILIVNTGRTKEVSELLRYEKQHNLATHEI